MNKAELLQTCRDLENVLQFLRQHLHRHQLLGVDAMIVLHQEGEESAVKLLRDQLAGTAEDKSSTIEDIVEEELQTVKKINNALDTLDRLISNMKMRSHLEGYDHE